MLPGSVLRRVLRKCLAVGFGLEGRRLRGRGFRLLKFFGRGLAETRLFGEYDPLA